MAFQVFRGRPGVVYDAPRPAWDIFVKLLDDGSYARVDMNSLYERVAVNGPPIVKRPTAGMVVADLHSRLVIPRDQQRLIFGERVLDTHMPLEHYSIPHGAHLALAEGYDIEIGNGVAW